MLNPLVSELAILLDSYPRINYFTLQHSRETMKEACLVLFSIFLVPPVMGQGKEPVQSDTLYAVQRFTDGPLAIPAVKLPAYQPDACLIPSLKQLIQTDKGCSDRIGYYVSLEVTQGRELINVSPIDLRRVRPGHFFGYFGYGNRVFLCAGNNDAYVSKAATADSLTLRAYVSTGFTQDDFFLGGDTDGTLQHLECAPRHPYMLLKPCTPPSQRRKSNK